MSVAEETGGLGDVRRSGKSLERETERESKWRSVREENHPFLNLPNPAIDWPFISISPAFIGLLTKSQSIDVI